MPTQWKGISYIKKLHVWEHLESCLIRKEKQGTEASRKWCEDRNAKRIFLKNYKTVCFGTKSLVIFTLLVWPYQNHIIYFVYLRTKLFSTRVFQADSLHRFKCIGVYPSSYKNQFQVWTFWQEVLSHIWDTPLLSSLLSRQLYYSSELLFIWLPWDKWGKIQIWIDWIWPLYQHKCVDAACHCDTGRYKSFLSPSMK